MIETWILNIFSTIILSSVFVIVCFINCAKKNDASGQRTTPFTRGSNPFPVNRKSPKSKKSEKKKKRKSDEMNDKQKTKSAENDKKKKKKDLTGTSTTPGGMDRKSAEAKEAEEEKKSPSKVPDAGAAPVDKEADESKKSVKLKPQTFEKNDKQKLIAEGKIKRNKGDYPTMEDVLSDWDSEGPKKNEKKLPAKSKSPDAATPALFTGKSPESKKSTKLKPQIFERNEKQKMIAEGKIKKNKGDYPTMDDVLSDWDSEKEGPKKNEKENDEKDEKNTDL